MGGGYSSTQIHLTNHTEKDTMKLNKVRSLSILTGILVSAAVAWAGGRSTASADVRRPA